MKNIVSLENPPSATKVLQQLLVMILITLGCGLLLSVLGGVAAIFMAGVKAEDLTAVDFAKAPARVIYAMEIIQVFSVLGLFIAPALIVPAFVFKTEPLRFLSLRKNSSLIIFLIAILAYACFSPFLEYSIALNLKMKLPNFLSGVEQWMKATEEANGVAIKRFLEMKNPSELIGGLLMIALLPAIAEELFFRGLLQRSLFQWTHRTHLSVFVTAFVFSAIHLQFYGFLPRFLLGLFLGYLLAWSGNIKLSMLAHFLNNAIAVVATYLYQNGDISASPDSPINYPQYLYFISPLAGGFMMYLFYKFNHHKTSQQETIIKTEEGNWVKVYSAAQRYQAEMVSGQLKAEGINSVVVDRKDSAYHFGEVEVFVSHEDAEKANAVLGIN